MEKINRKIILVVVVCLLANIVGCADVKHGIAVASIISAENHSDSQVKGIACGANLISIDVTNQSDGAVKEYVEGLDFSKGMDFIKIINNYK